MDKDRFAISAKIFDLKKKKFVDKELISFCEEIGSKYGFKTFESLNKIIKYYGIYSIKDFSKLSQKHIVKICKVQGKELLKIDNELKEKGIKINE